MLPEKVSAPKSTITETWDWPEAMKRVANVFSGYEGVFLQLGDSLTLARPNVHWAIAGKGRTIEETKFLEWAHAGTRDDKDGWHLATAVTSSSDWSVTTYTATVGCSSEYVLTGKRGLPPLRELISTYNPQMAVYAVGLSDVLRQVPAATYMKRVAESIGLLRANGTVPILSTLTPCPAHNQKVLAVNRLLRAFAEEEKLPLLDIYAAMESRKKDVFEFLDDDHLHLTSFCSEGPATKENLSMSGYLLKSYLTVRKGIEVKQKVLDCRDARGLRQKMWRSIRRWRNEDIRAKRLSASFSRVLINPK
jgi:hypothetical protein